MPQFQKMEDMSMLLEFESAFVSSIPCGTMLKGGKK